MGDWRRLDDQAPQTMRKSQHMPDSSSLADRPNDPFERLLDTISFDKLERGQFYDRFEDMSPTGKLSVLMQDDGDMIVTIWPDMKDDGSRHCSAEFCTRCGGGQSPRVRKALVVLAEAIRRDNEERVQHRG